MRYGKFPRLNRWLEFESHDDYLRYKNSKRKVSAWELHAEKREKQFKELIDKKSSEPAIHTFLEENPYLLPGFGDLHHGPYEGIIATKLSLGRSFITDFAYIASNSQTLFFTCVEIESAKKRLFRSDGKFHRDYLDARQQIVDWLHWAEQNQKEAIDCWGAMFNGRPASWFRIAFRGFLVFGRRSEFDTREKQERWSAEASSLHSGLSTMTYDRLLQRNSYVHYNVDNTNLAVCSYRERRFIVKKVIP